MEPDNDLAGFFKVTADTLVLAGLVGLLGAAVCALSDIVLLYKPIDGKTYYRDPIEVMVKMSNRRLVWGGALGVVSLPLAVLGLFQVYYMLAPAGQWLALPPVLLLGWMFIMGCASHGAWAFMGHIYRTRRGNPTAAMTTLAKDAHVIWNVLLRASGVAYLCGSLWLAVAIVVGPTLYPTWFVLLNPLILYFAQEALTRNLPAPFGGLWAPITSNLVWVIFYPVSTALYTAT
ncbi:MAG: DUF6796 family protein [Pseudomonadota bacterium]